MWMHVYNAHVNSGALRVGARNRREAWHRCSSMVEQGTMQQLAVKSLTLHVWRQHLEGMESGCAN